MRWVLLLVLLLGAGCPKGPDPSNDAGIDAGNGQLVPCLERPDDTPQPPGSALPCDLLPPSQ